jgi:hypothetical protein
MKKLSFIFCMLLIGQLAIAQAPAVAVTYNQLLIKTGLNALAAGGQLVVSGLSPDNEKILKLTYNYGNNLDGTYDGGTQTKSYQLGATMTVVELNVSAQVNYRLSLADHQFTDLPAVQAVAPLDHPAGPNTTANAGTAVPENAPYKGIAFSDAITIYNLLKTNTADDKAKIKVILAYYGASSTDFSTLQTTNPFLKVGFVGPATTTLTGQPNGALDAVGGLDVTNIVQALADFLSDRIKQELSIAYLQKLKDSLASHQEIQQLLPNTYEAFKDNDLFNLPSLGATFKQAFAQDLAALPDNLIQWVYQTRYDGFTDGSKDYFIAGASLYKLINQTAKGYHPSVSLHNLAIQFPYDGNINVKSKWVIGVLDMLSQNLLDSKNFDNWVGPTDLSSLNPSIIRLFFALLYEKYQPLFKDQVLSGHLVDLADNAHAAKLTNSLYSFVTLAANMDQKIQAAKILSTDPKATAADKAAGVVTFFLNNSDAMMDLLNYGFGIIDPNDTHKAAYTTIIKSAGDAVSIAKGVQSNNFAQASNSTIAFMTDVFSSSNDTKFIKTLKNILAFANDVVAAKTAEDIKAVLETYAAPVQSYQAVRKSNFSFSLHAYPGVYVGTEKSQQNNVSLFDHGTFGVTAPFGFAMNWGNSTKDVSSEGVFISMIDIGAALSYRFNNSTSDIPSKITLGQIFSPGAHFVYGIKKSPLVIKVGYQYAPELRQITTDAVNTTTGGVWRLSLGLCADIPVHFFTQKH